MCVCADIVPVKMVILPVKEASQADVIAGIAIAFLVLGAALLIVFDAQSLKSSLFLFCKNSKAVCCSKSEQ